MNLHFISHSCVFLHLLAADHCVALPQLQQTRRVADNAQIVFLKEARGRHGAGEADRTLWAGKTQYRGDVSKQTPDAARLKYLQQSRFDLPVVHVQHRTEQSSETVRNSVTPCLQATPWMAPLWPGKVLKCSICTRKYRSREGMRTEMKTKKWVRQKYVLYYSASEAL